MIDSNVLLLGGHQPRTMATVRRCVSTGDTALDIGANAGYYTLPLAQFVGPTGRVVAFEPTQWAYEKLQTNVGLNDFANIRTEKLALSDSAAERDVASSETAFRASWPLAGGPQLRPAELVQFVRLDDYVRGENIDSVDFVKIDVDGFELRVLAEPSKHCGGFDRRSSWRSARRPRPRSEMIRWSSFDSSTSSDTSSTTRSGRHASAHPKQWSMPSPGASR